MRKTSVRLKYLDSLRGLAAYIVVAGHFFPDGWVKNLPVLNLVTDTTLAVAIFFVLSGVVLTNPKNNVRSGLIWLPIQFVARFFRLLIPVLAVSLFVWLLYYFDFMFSDELPESYQQWDAFLQFYRTDVNLFRALYFSWVEVFFLFDASTSLIPPAWTMRPELFGSIVVLSYVWLLQRKLISIYPQGLIFVSVVLILTYGHFPFFYYFSFFLTGSALRHLSGKELLTNKLPVLWLLAVLGLKTLFNTLGFNNFQLDYVFAGLIVFLLIEAKSVHEIMCKPALLWLAKISFPLYLLHVPLICSFGLFFMKYLSATTLDAGIGQFVVFFALSLLVLLVSRIFLPFETLGIQVSRWIRAKGKIEMKKVIESEK